MRELMNMQENCSNKNERVGEIVRIFLKGQNWWANYQLRGRQKRTSLRTTSKKEARRRALLLEADIVRGNVQSEGKSSPIDVAIDSYRSYLKAERRSKKTLVKYNKVLGRVQDLALRTG